MKRRLGTLATGLVVCALLAGAVMSFVTFGRENAQLIEENQHAALKDLAEEQNVALRTELDGMFEVMRTLAAAVPQLGQEQVIWDFLRRSQQSAPFTYVGVVDAQGNAYVSDGTPVSMDILGLEDLTEPMVRYAQGQALFLFAAPMEGGGAVFACYPEERFVHLLSTQAMSESSYAFLAGSDGQVIVHSDHPSYVSISNNTLRFYEEVVMENGCSAQQVAQDMARGQAGMLTYSYGNQYRYVIYAPVGINDWFLFSVVDGNQIEAQTNLSMTLVWRLAARLLIIAALAAALLIARDRRRERRAEELARQLQDSEQIRRMAQQMSYTILFEADPQTGAIFYNEAFERQLGHKPRIDNFNDFFKDDVPIAPEEVQAWRRLAEEMKRGLPKSQVSVCLPHSNGEKIWYRVSFQTLYNQDKSRPVRVVGRMANIERQEREQDKQLAQAERDELTGLMGHMAFMQRAAKRLHREDACALLIADIDGFKGARDIDGRYQGDQLLVRMSDAMRQVFDEGDLLGRLGGDTFAVLMAGGATPEAVARRAGALCEAFEEADGHTCSVGIALAGQDVDSISELSHRADKALYRAKLAGKHRYEFYEGMVAEHLASKGRGDDASQLVKRCAVALLTSEALALGMDEVLREVAQYYRASRAYVMQTNPKGDQIRETYSWCAPGHEPPGGEWAPIREGSLLKWALDEHHTLSVPEINENTVADPAELKALRERRVMAMYMAPMGVKAGFLGIENPKDHVGNATALKQVAVCVASALSKLQK